MTDLNPGAPGMGGQATKQAQQRAAVEASGDRDPALRLEAEKRTDEPGTSSTSGTEGGPIFLQIQPAPPALSEEALARLEADATVLMGRYPRARSALLPMLHLVQSEQGYVTPDGIEFCARMLGLTPAEVTAVATFYTQYKRHPMGEYSVGVCTNTLCAVLGGDTIYSRLKEHLGVGHDETTPDGKVTLEHLECNAACDYAPVMMVNWEFFDNQTPESAVELVDALQAGTPPKPTRGASLRSFKETSRVLAGFYDGRADEGIGAGHASLAGLSLAQHGVAPARDDTTGPGSSSSDEQILDGAAVGYGAPAPGHAGPSGHDAPLQTAASDPANATPAGAADEVAPMDGGDRSDNRPTSPGGPTS